MHVACPQLCWGVRLPDTPVRCRSRPAAGLPEQEASDWAYLTAEIINWEWMLQILKSAEWKGTPQEAVEIIRAAIIVDEGIKVTVEAEKTE